MTEIKKNHSKEWNNLPEKTQDIIKKYQKVDMPKVPVGKIAQELGLIVKSSSLPVRISGEIRPDGNEFIIRINRHEAKQRQRFTLAHEISHYLLHRDKINDGIEDNVLYRSQLSNIQEHEANRLAADILMPWEIIEAQLEGKNKDDENTIEEIASVMEISTVALRIRLGIKI